MTELELDNFRSMRGKSSGNTEDVAHSFIDDVFDLADRLADVKKRKELQKRVVDVTGQAYAILVTATDVRLQHNDERGNYHYNHFGSEKPAKHARVLGERRDPERVKERWQVIDDESTGHVFAHITPKHVTINHRDGVWRCCRIGGMVLELEDSSQLRPSSKKIPLPAGLVAKPTSQTRIFRLYGDNEDTNTRNESKPVEPLLCANTPGERDSYGRHPKAHQSHYHDL